MLEVAIGIIRRIRKAHKQQKDLARVLSSHYDELINTNIIIQVVKDEEALRTAAITSKLVKIKAIAARLVNYLKAVDPGTKSSMRQHTHQLVHGSKDKKALTNIIDELSRVKFNLSLHIQVANVGLTQTIKDTIVANTEVLNQIDLVLQQVFSKGRGLKLAKLLKDRSARDNGIVPLSDADIACLSNEVASPTGNTDAAAKPVANAPTLRIIIDNSTQEQALQINRPIGEKGWWEVSHLKIRNNKAVGKSIQVNHGTSIDVFKRLLAARAADLSG